MSRLIGTAFTINWATLAPIFQVLFVFSCSVAGAFGVWRAGTKASQDAVQKQTESTLKAATQAALAEKLRADAEKARAEQQSELVAAWEIKNAELLRSSVADQTKYLISMKTLTGRIIELETQLGIPHDTHN